MPAASAPLDTFAFASHDPPLVRAGVAAVVWLPAFLLARALIPGSALAPALAALVFAAAVTAFVILPASTETLVVIPGAGLQYTTATFLLGTRARFIPLGAIENVLLNEVLSFFTVRFVLIVAVRERDGALSLRVLFERSMPRLHALLPAFRASRACLLGDCDSKDLFAGSDAVEVASIAVQEDKQSNEKQ